MLKTLKPFKAVALAATLFSLGAGSALADANTEAFVRQNANDVLASLNDPDISAAERRIKFQTYMDEFANIDTVARFVIGKYASRFSETDLAAYEETFRAYALAVYEHYFNAYKGQEVDVTGSIDRNARDSIVDTDILSASGETMQVRWRVLNRGGEYQVVDIALNAEGNLIWLAIEQQAQFLSILDKNNGRADALIKKIEGMTADLIAQREE
ncbi:MAG: ABC transporter substrate-binding protein [Pseudomonadota bacterium]